MKNNKQYPMLIIALVLIGAFTLVTLIVLPTNAARRLGQSLAKPELMALDGATALRGIYIGEVTLERAQPGEYSQPLPPPVRQPGEEPLPDLGEIDLGLLLVQAGTTVTGYVDLDITLVFSGEHTVDGVVYGPAVSGTYDGTDLVLESERLSFVSAGQRLMRQFRLTGTISDTNRLIGEYRETLWGYGPQPLTMIGNFVLQGPPINPDIELAITVGTEPGVCAAEDTIYVTPGTVVYYCYTVTNTGDVTLSTHKLEDGLYGLILDDVTYVLEPGASWDTISAGITVSATIHGRTVNGATWKAFNPGPFDETLDGGVATVELGVVYLPVVIRR